MPGRSARGPQIPFEFPAKGLQWNLADRLEISWQLLRVPLEVFGVLWELLGDPAEVPGVNREVLGSS